MRGILLALLAGLLAVTAQPVSALCADDGNGGCSAFRQDLVLTVRDDCPDAGPTVLCLVAPDQVDGLFIPGTGILNLTLVNGLRVPIDFEVYITARFDDAQASDGTARVRADRILLLEDIQPGEARNHEWQVDGNASALRFQALSADARHGERDAEVTPIMLMTGGAPEPDPAQDGTDQSHQPVVDERKDAPMLGAGAVAVALGAVVALAAFFGLRKYD